MSTTSLRSFVCTRGCWAQPSPRWRTPFSYSTSSIIPLPRRAISTYGYEQAKALVYSQHGEPKDVLRLHSHSISPPHSDLLTLRLLASPINPADINTIQGTYASLPPFTTSLSTSTPCAVPGNEGVAEVLSAGSSAFVVSPSPSSDEQPPLKYKRGDRVLFRRPHSGTFRTHIQLPAHAVYPLPDPDGVLTPTQAAILSINPVTAWALLKGQTTTSTSSSGPEAGAADEFPNAPKQGAWSAQNGANSAVGRAVIQLAAAWGIRTINVVRSRVSHSSSTPSSDTPPIDEASTAALKSELTALGATLVVTEEEASAKGFASGLRASHIGDAGVALALNCVGGRSALNLAKLLALPSPPPPSSSSSTPSTQTPTPEKHHITYGAMARQPLTLPASLLIFSPLHFSGFWVSRWGEANPGLKARAIAEVVALIRQGRFRDAPVREIRWGGETEEGALVAEVQRGLEGRAGKGVFVFE